MNREEMFPLLVTQKSLIGTNEAIEISSNALHRLGYDRPEWLDKVFVTQYTFSPDAKKPQKPMPIFSVRWFPSKPPLGYEYSLFEFEIYGVEKRVTCFSHLPIDGDSKKNGTFNLLNYTNSHSSP